MSWVLVGARGLYAYSRASPLLHAQRGPHKCLGSARLCRSWLACDALVFAYPFAGKPAPTKNGCSGSLCFFVWAPRLGASFWIACKPFRGEGAAPTKALQAHLIPWGRVSSKERRPRRELFCFWLLSFSWLTAPFAARRRSHKALQAHLIPWERISSCGSVALGASF